MPEDSFLLYCSIAQIRLRAYGGGGEEERLAVIGCLLQTVCFCWLTGRERMMHRRTMPPGLREGWAVCMCSRKCSQM